MAIAKFLKTAKKIQEEHLEKKSERKKPGLGEHHDESNWLISYADMMTLLCGFFVMLFSLATVDPPKYEKVKEAISKEFKGEYVLPSSDLAKTMTEALQDAGVSDQVSVQSDALGVSVIFQSAVFFDTLSAEVRPEGRTILDKLIGKISDLQGKNTKHYRVVVEGHTDSRPVLAGTFPTNWELSGSRAARVVRLFLDHGFNPSLLAAIGYADTRPELPSRTPAGEWDEAALRKNRRVVIRVLEPSVESVPIAATTVNNPTAPSP